MSKKQKYKSLRGYQGTKGIKMDSSSKTIQDDSFSVKEMLEKHVQGVLDPSLYNEGLYDDDNIDTETDVSHRQQKTELDALQYAEENGMTQQEVEAYLKEHHAIKDEPEGQTTSEVVEDVKTAENEPTSDG